MKDRDDIKKYSDITPEKIKAIIEEILNSEPHRSNQNYIDNMYRNMTPEGRKLFNEALQAEMVRQRDKEFMFGTNNKALPIVPDKDDLDYNPIYKGKIRKKNTHLIPKKKKRKK